jgi:hypothetical protein
MACGSQVSIRMFAPFVDVVARLGLNAKAALARVGLPATGLADSELRVGHDVLERLLRTAVANCVARGLGLSAAEETRPEHLDALEYIARSQATLGDALQSIEKFAGGCSRSDIPLAASLPTRSDACAVTSCAVSHPCRRVRPWACAKVSSQFGCLRAMRICHSRVVGQHATFGRSATTATRRSPSLWTLLPVLSSPGATQALRSAIASMTAT